MDLSSDSIHNDYKLIYLPKVNSTNDYAWNLISNSTPTEKVVVITDNQTAGRGQYDRRWQVDSGKNITMSVIMALNDVSLKNAFHLNIVVSSSILKAIKKLTGVSLKVKWPNDIYYGERKLGGILIKNKVVKNQIQHTVIGIGINVNQKLFHSSIPNPVSLQNILGTEISLKTLVHLILDELACSFNSLPIVGIKSMHSFYLNNLFAKGHLRNYRVKSETKRLSIVDVKTTGEIILIDESEISFSFTSGLEYILQYSNNTLSKKMNNTK